MQFALREWWAFVSRPRLWATFLVVVLLFTLTGPLGTILTMNLAERFTYWLVLHGAAWSIAIFCALLADTALNGALHSLLARLIVGSLAAALPIGLAVMLLDRLFLEQPISLTHFLQASAISLPLCLLFCVLTYLTVSREEAGSTVALPRHGSAAEAVNRASPAPAPAAAVSTPLARRLKPENRGALIRLSAEDHYTEVVTESGRELLLIRFADALGELGEADGMQVHRSHWVAVQAVKGFRREQGRS